MKSENETIGSGVSEHKVRLNLGGSNGLVQVREYMSYARGYAFGYACFVLAFCLALVLGVGRSIDLHTRMASRFAFRLNHPHNWPAFLYFGSLLAGVLFLVAYLIVKRHPEVIQAEGNEKLLVTAGVFLLLVDCALMGIGEIAMRWAIAGGW